MPPTETSILTKYLLLPSPLPTIISFPTFTTLFPPSLRSSPHIRTLYHDLQSQRTDLLEQVSVNIAIEVSEGKALRRAVARQRRELEKEEGDDEIAVEQALFGSNDPNQVPHTIDTLIPTMEAAIAALEAQIKTLEEEEEDILANMRKTVGSLSDLRYGKLANRELHEEILDGLKTLETTCRSK